MGSLLIYRDNTKCIIDYDHVMHIRRFTTDLPKLILDLMPTAKVISYNCSLTTSREFLPDETKLPGIKFRYNHTCFGSGTIEMLKAIPFDEPTILIVELAEKSNKPDNLIVEWPNEA